MSSLFFPIPGFEGFYEINIRGQVRSISRYVNSGRYEAIRFEHSRIMKQTIEKGKRSYYKVKMMADNKRTTRTVHRILAMVFLENPENKAQVNHIDGNKKNNELYNLEWATHLENVQHSIRTGLTKPCAFGEDASMSLLSNQQVLEIFHSSENQKALAVRFNVSRGTISSIKRGQGWSKVTGKQHVRVKPEGWGSWPRKKAPRKGGLGQGH